MAAKPNVKPLYKRIKFSEAKINVNTLITKTNKNGIITFVSKGYKDMTRYTSEELLGNPHSIVRHPLMPESAFKEMWENILLGKYWECIVCNLRKDGLHYWVTVQITPLDLNGKIVFNEPGLIKGFIAIRREPSEEEIEKKQIQYATLRKNELERKNKLKDWEKETLEICDKILNKKISLL